MTLNGAEKGVRQKLDDWRFWVGVAYFGLVAVVVALFFINRDISREQTREAAEQRASSVSQVSTCADAVRNAPDVEALIAAIRFNVSDRVAATKDAIRVAPEGDPLAKVRQESLVRLRNQLARIDRLTAGFRKSTPTRAKCNALARKVGVPIPFPQKGAA